ncbi:MAG: C10 family peptidase, partial [Muribaculaceae bacterium]|nr:C10 family peptidase [Muribaculaceae bacterium]
MKKILLLLTVAIAALSLQAAPIDKNAAAKVAKNYLANEMYAGKMMAPAATNPVLVKTEYGTDKKLNQPVYYIYNTSTTFLVVSGDDRAEEILMVGDKPLNMDRIPDGLQYLLDCYKEQIDFLQANPTIVVERPSHQRNQLRAVTYGPLLTAKWDQEAPYNNLCKFTYNNRTYTCLTGCPATSAAMVFYYWKYPTAQIPAMASYTGRLYYSSTNENTYTNFTYPALDAVTFDWGNMKDTYNSYNSAQASAVATLMRYIGQAEQMMYGVLGSGILTTQTQIVANMFINWGYNSTCSVQYKSGYSATKWAELIIAEMAAGRPVIYNGVDNSAGGHAFNVDGYRDSDSKYHVNFGWSGDGNSWYAMNAFTYGGYTFSSDQQAVIGIQPPGGQVTTPELSVSPTSLAFESTPGATVTKTF